MKTNFIIRATLSLGVALLGGCKSSDDPIAGTTTVSGQVVVYQTNKPVPNATVQVYKSGAGGGYGVQGTGQPTDAQGRFSFAFEADEKSDYLLRATAAPGYFTDWALGARPTNGRSNTGLVIQAYAPAWIKIQLVNTSGRKRYSVIINGYSGGGELIYGPKDTTLIRPIQAGYRTTVSWGIVDQATGSTSGSYQYVQPVGLDTIGVRIPL